MDSVYKGVASVNIVYFSGTGSTERVADCFEKSVLNRGIKVVKTRLDARTEYSNEEVDMLLVLYAVHACNAPEPVYEWIRRASSVNKTRAVVISVSGGGEITPNTACRVGCIKRLQKKGYSVVYEDMIVMPSNFITPTVEGLAVRLLKVLPLKVEQIVNEILSGVTRRTKPNLLNKFLAAVSELEKLGAGLFGKRIRVSEDCSGCRWCERNCPRGNITFDDNKPVFHGRCVICLKCIYGCPGKALKPGFFKLFVFKEGYDLEDIEKRMERIDTEPVEDLAKGYLWKGVKEYLLEFEPQKK